MTLDFASGVTAALLFVIVAGPIVLFVVTNRYLARGANCRSLDKLFIAFLAVILIDGGATLGALFADVPLNMVLAAGLSELTASVVDASLFQDTLHGTYLAVGAALTIALAKQLAAVRFERADREYPQI